MGNDCAILPTNQPGAHRTDGRRVISRIIHVLRSGCRWQDCPACYGPPTTVYNRFHRWSAKEYGGGCLKLWCNRQIGTSI
ncbi:transposase [Brucella intermedia]|nr:transposase [Brucella intermedia]